MVTWNNHWKRAIVKWNNHKKVGSRYARVLVRIGKWMRKSPEVKTFLIVVGIILAFYIMFAYPLEAMLFVLFGGLWVCIQFIYWAVKQK